jgi:aspartate dehydrogenase
VPVKQGETRAVAVGGFGAVGRRVAEALDAGELPGLRLTAVSARNAHRAEEALRGYRQAVPVRSLGELADLADIVVECAPAALLEEIARPALEAGRTLVVISVGALLERAFLVDLAARHGGRIVVPSGALLGLDAVTAAAEGEIRSVRMVTCKPVRGLMGAPYLVEHGIELAGLDSPRRVFEGSAREAARGFPANLNVAAALSLAGIGADRTRVEVWADPTLERNVHEIHVEADSASFRMTIENVPSENPKTGRITALSVIAALRKLAGPLRVGT